jgi:cell division protein FtsQ
MKKSVLPEPQVAEATKAKRSKFAKRAASFVLTALALSGGVWLVGFSSYLALDASQITVESNGDTLADLDAIRQFIAKRAHIPLAQISTTDVRDHIENQPGVMSARVELAWLNGIRVEIEPRIPLAAVVTETGFSWIDASGIEVIAASDPGGLPKVQAPVSEQAVLAEVVKVWQVLPESLQSSVRHLSASTIDDISFVLTSGQVIRFGSSEQLKLKVATAQALLNTAPNSKTIDVSSPTLPITR